MLAQRTLKSLTRAVGVGLHSGQRVELSLRPAPPDTGIVFRRVDLPQPVDIVISAQAVTDTRLASTISNGSAKVHTVEHLMSACAGLGIDNLYIDITAEEVPILDGSASSFVFLLQSAGIELQAAPKRFVRVIKPVEVREGEGANVKWARLSPYEGYKLSFEIDFDHPAVDSTGQLSRLYGPVQAEGLLPGGAILDEVLGPERVFAIFPARPMTYAEIETAVAHAFVGQETPQLRDRYGRHAWGQSCLLARRLVEAGVTFVSVHMGGWDDHAQIGNAMNNKLLRELLSHKDAWEVVTFEDEKRAPRGFATLARAW